MKSFQTVHSNAAVRLPRLADVVADQVREAILLGELQDGERLPPIDALQSQFGVSAPSMREALRVLEAEGLVVVQRGGIGGAIVRTPTAKTAAYNLALALHGRGTEKRDVAEAVATLQPLCALLCARRGDRKSKVVRELRKLNKAANALVEGDEMLFNDAMLEFHRAIVRLAGNDTLTLVTHALEHICFSDVRGWVARTASHGEYPSVDPRRREITFHEEITDLIDSGDEAVAEVMRQHIEDTVYRNVIGTDERVDPRTVRLSSMPD